jgi:hypothetical protein
VAGAHFRIWRYGRSKRRYVVIHDEETARQVLTAHMRTGVAYIIEGQTRNVAIEGGQIDPNRMFSRFGAEASLRRLNPGWEAERMALAVLDRGREDLVKALIPPPGGLTIALHNISQNYSVQDEEPMSDAGSIREPGNPRALFVCTDEGDFRKPAVSPYNAVLQKKPEDHGSLSRLAAARGARYINLEVALGQSGRQKEMQESAGAAPSPTRGLYVSARAGVNRGRPHEIGKRKWKNSTRICNGSRSVRNRSCAEAAFPRLMKHDDADRHYLFRGSPDRDEVG